MTAQDLEEYAKRKEDEAARLEREYWGVRPGWVSTDIALAKYSAAEARRQANETRGAA